MDRMEHPKPQFERSTWQNLNGLWDFEIDWGVSGKDREWFKEEKIFSKKINVPFCPESELSGINEKDFMNCVWYKRDVEISKAQLEGRVFLHFGAVDYIATVYVNGVEVGTHRGGHVSFKFEITDFVKEGANKITVCALDNFGEVGIPRGKQCDKYNSYFCLYTRTTGIWQTVWLEFTPKNYIEKVKYYPDIDNCSLTVIAKVVGEGELAVNSSFEGKFTGSAKVNTCGDTAILTLKLTEKHLWEVGKGGLYDLHFTFGQDSVKSYFGLRKAALKGNKFTLNDKVVYLRFSLDQGYYPDGIMTAPNDEELKRDVERGLELGFNGARFHQKVFEERYLYYCDKLGYMGWGEFANWGSAYTYQEIPQFLQEWEEVIDRDFNHPSIITWCPMNETSRNETEEYRDFVKTIYRTTKQLDWTRPCVDTSGYLHVETDIYDVHGAFANGKGTDWPKEFAAYFNELKETGEFKPYNEGNCFKKGMPFIVSEFSSGIYDFDKDYGKATGRNFSTPAQFLEEYIKPQVDCLLDNPNMMGFCIIQLYDIELELNGMYTYDRRLKYDKVRLKEIISRKAAIED